VTAADRALQRRARRLARWYPRSWRTRYGEEFCAMLECELAERPVSVASAANVAWSGLVARASAGGLVGIAHDRELQPRRSLAWVTGGLAAFLCFALAMWSQLVVGWQWTPPRTTGTTIGTVVMSLGVLVLAALGAVALAPVLAGAAVRLVRGPRRTLLVPVAVAVLSAVVLVVGARRFENGWPGTGGHHWADQGLVPGGVAAFVWAATLSVTSYWAHPGALGAFPSAEVAWMAASPVAIVCLGVAATVTVRRLELSARVQRLELRLGQLAALAMGLMLFGTLAWLTDAAPRPVSVPADLFHVGVIDVVGAGVMALALALVVQASHRGLLALRAAT
jgi:hypothetical protein